MRYREIAPSPAFAQSIECFWTTVPEPGETAHRVTPDGCADVVLSSDGLILVGAMTEFQDVASSGVTTGVRFRPAMWTSQFRIRADRITDRVVALEDVWGSRARALAARLDPAASLEHAARTFESILQPTAASNPFQRAVEWMQSRHGCLAMDELARRTGLSVRQLRRVSLEQTGLTPKFLARVLRFRHAAARIEPGAGADLALECGYYDQAHFINEFREFSGRTPSMIDAMADFSNRRRRAVA
jgi:AraC-like DNA-binding protein